MAASRSNGLKPILVGILIFFLTIGLTLFMITDAFTPNNVNAAASLGRTNVTLSEFKNEFDSRLLSYNQNTATRITPTQAYNQGLAQQVMDTLVTQKTMLVDADDLGIGVSKGLMVTALEQYPIFQNELTGKFDDKKMQDFLVQERMSQDMLQDIIGGDLTINQTLPAIIGGLQAPANYAEQRFKYLTEQRKISVLTINEQGVPPVELPTDEQLQTFIDENRANYTAPEYRSFTLVRLERFDLNPDIRAIDASATAEQQDEIAKGAVGTIDESDIRAHYEERLAAGLLGTPETRSVEILNVTNETIAEEAKKLLGAGRTFAETATSLGLVEPTNYTDVEADAILDSDTAEAAFAAQTGEIIVVEGLLSSYVARVTNVTPAVAPDFNSLRDEIASTLKEDQALDQLYERIGILEDQIGQGQSLIDAAKEAGISYATLSPVSRLGETQDGLRMAGFDGLPGIAADDEILTQIFTNDIGYQTDVFETDTDGFAIIQVEDIIDSRPYELSEVRDRAQAAYVSREYDTALTNVATDLTQRARDNESLEALATELGDGASLEEIVINRSGASDKISGSVAARLFEASEEEIIYGDGPTGTTRNIAKLLNIVQNNDGLAGGYAAAMSTQVQEAISSDIQAAYRAEIMNRNEVRTYDDRIRQVIGVTE